MALGPGGHPDALGSLFHLPFCRWVSSGGRTAQAESSRSWLAAQTRCSWRLGLGRSAHLVSAPLYQRDQPTGPSQAGLKTLGLQAGPGGLMAQRLPGAAGEH